MKGLIAFILFLGMAWMDWTIPLQVSASSPEIIEGAKREGGEVVYYGGGDTVADQAISKGFTKKYPFLRAKKFRIQSQRLMTRFEAESKAGKHVADIVQTADWYIDMIRQKGLLMAYDSAERKFYSDQFKDPQGYYTAIWKYLHVMVYNTKLVSKQEIPRSYEDLLHSRWKNRLGFVDSTSGSGIVWFVNQLEIRGADQGLKFMKSLAAQNVRMHQSSALLSNLVAGGEIPLAIDLYGYQAENLKRKGAPIDWIAAEPTVVHAVLSGISKNAPHPNAAKLFQDYLVSEEGQRIILSFDKNPTRKGLYVPWYPKGIKEFVSNPRQMDSEKFDRYQNMFLEIFGK